jgi:hypothetical protein
MLEIKIIQIKTRINSINQMNEKNSYLALVNLFNFANNINDEGGLTAPKPFLDLNLFKTKKITEQKALCAVLNTHLSQLSRDEFGLNRAKKHTPSTNDNTFVGGVHGFFTQPVSFWLKKDREPVLEKWVQNFVISHTNGITKALTTF